jgi:hypothetical protein
MKKLLKFTHDFHALRGPEGKRQMLVVPDRRPPLFSAQLLHASPGHRAARARLPQKKGS